MEAWSTVCLATDWPTESKAMVALWWTHRFSHCGAVVAFARQLAVANRPCKKRGTRRAMPQPTSNSPRGSLCYGLVVPLFGHWAMAVSVCQRSSVASLFFV